MTKYFLFEGKQVTQQTLQRRGWATGFNHKGQLEIASKPLIQGDYTSRIRHTLNVIK